MIEDDPKLRCWNYKLQDSEFCQCHQQFPNLGDECHQRSNRVCSREEFMERFYPTARRKTFPIDGDKFLDYLQRICGHDGLCQIQYKVELEPKWAEDVKKIVDEVLPWRVDPSARAAHVNHSLSDEGSPFRAAAKGEGFVTSFDLKGQRYETAAVSHP